MDDTAPISREAYEQLAERYALCSDNKIENAYLDRPATLALLPPVEGKTVLDAGCGPGAYAVWLVEHGAQVIAFDVSPKMVEITKRRLGSSIDVRVADISKPLDFITDESIDIVLCPLVLSYVRDPAPVYREFNRVLRTGGHVVISVGHPWCEFKLTKNQNYFETEPLSCKWIGFGEPHVEVPFYRKSLTNVLRPLCQSGFKIEDFVEPLPTAEGRRVDPETYEKLCRNPGFLSLRAVKTQAAGTPGRATQEQKGLT